MKILLANNILLESKPKQVLLRKISKTDKRVYKRTIGYYTSLEDALEGYIKLNIQDSNAVTLGQLLSEVRDLKEYTKEIIRIIVKKL